MGLPHVIIHILDWDFIYFLFFHEINQPFLGIPLWKSPTAVHGPRVALVQSFAKDRHGHRFGQGHAEEQQVSQGAGTCFRRESSLNPSVKIRLC